MITALALGGISISAIGQESSTPGYQFPSSAGLQPISDITARSSISFLQPPTEPGADVLKPQRVTAPPPPAVPSVEFELPEIDGEQPFQAPTTPPFVQPMTPQTTVTPGVFWIDHIDGDPYGRTPYTSIGTNQFPVLTDSTALMIDASGRITNNGEGGSTIGVHVRNVVDSPLGAVVAGTGFYYDATQTPNDNVFHQLSLAGELLLPGFSVRWNGYHPVGPSVRNVNTENRANPVFNGDTLQAAVGAALLDDEVATKGMDVDLGVNLGNTDLQGFVGYYHFKGSRGVTVDGINGGIRGLIGERAGGFVTVANDNVFGTSVFGGLSFYFDPFGGRMPAGFGNLLTQRVVRTPLTLINRVQTQRDGVLTDLTEGGNVITITHVDSANSGNMGDGTADNPFGTLGDADSSTADIVYVHADSVFDNESFSIADHQRLLGEGGGVTHLVNTDQLGAVALPAGNGGMDRPILNAPIMGVTLGSNSEISNFVINGGATGAAGGIIGTNLTGVTRINHLSVNDGMAGILLNNNPAATFIISDVAINGASNSGIVAQNTGQLFVQSTDITLNSDSGIGIGYFNTDGSFTLFDSMVDFVSTSPNNTIGVLVINNSDTNAMTLDGLRNTVTNAVTSSNSQDAGGGFIGTIEINNGTDDLP